MLVSLCPRLYLDRPHGDKADNPEQEADRRRVGLPVYPPSTLRDFVEWDPVTVTPGVTDDSRLAGVEAAIWGETVTDRSDLEFLLMPRLYGVGEKAWGAGGTVWDEYAGRLGPQSRVWSRRGWSWFRAEGVAWSR